MNNKYIAFISYSRKDKQIADWLHSKLEHYILPNKEDAQKIFPFESKYCRPVFLDTQDLHVEERPFTESIRTAIKNSAFLIVLCSKHSAISPFVEKEIKFFLETHDNNLSRIVPLFIDEVDGCIPAPFNDTTIMQRHFPIYNSKLSHNSEANNYCFYQIVSYILHIDFSDIYNRYEADAAKSAKRRRRFLTILSTALSCFLLILTIGSYLIIEKQKRIIEFEKKVFPASVVHGYERNFLTPAIKHLKEESKPFTIYVLMPVNSRDLEHQDRVGDFLYNFKLKMDIDSLPVENLPTETKRGSRIFRIAKDGQLIDGIYLDFATTTTSFLEIAKFKRRYREYKRIPLDSIINEYAHDFVQQSNRRLHSDSLYVKFYYDKNKLINDLQDIINH